MSEEKRTPQLDPSRFRLAEQVRRVWVMTVEAGLTQDQVSSPAFLAHVAAKCQPYDRIEARADDDSLFAELLVVSVAHATAVVRVLRWEDLEGAADDPGEAPTGYRVEWKGPHKKHCVIRDADSAIVHEGAASKADARVWLENHLKVIRKAA